MGFDEGFVLGLVVFFFGSLDFEGIVLVLVDYK